MNYAFSLNKMSQLLATVVIASALTACGGEVETKSSNNTNNTSNAASGWSSPVTTTMDASDSSKIAVFDLSSGSATSVSSMDSYTANWHFSYQKYRYFHTNSGTSGSGNNGTEVESCRAYEYSGLYDSDGKAVQTEFEKLTATNTLAKFESLDTGACTSFTKDSEVTPKYIGSDWYATSGFNLSIPAGTKWWIIKSANNTYARITPKSYNSGLIFTMEKWNGSSWNSALDTPTIDYYGQTNAYYDFDTNTAGTSDTQGWDLHIKNTNHYPEIILADGVTMAYYYDSDADDNFTYESVAQIDNPTAPTVGAKIYKWFGNETDGSMRKPADLGAIEMIEYSYFPTYTTYMFKDASNYYKVQVLGYKGTDGAQDSGHIVIRYSTKSQ